MYALKIAILSLIIFLFVDSSMAFQGVPYDALLKQLKFYHELSEGIYRGDGSYDNLDSGQYHSQMRDSGRRAQGYLDLAAVLSDPIYEQRARACCDWLVNQQNSDGHFTWWARDGAVDNNFDCMYPTGISGAALAEGYKKWSISSYLTASSKAAQWEASREIVWNTNYNMFSVWHLALHYEISGDQNALNAAVSKANTVAIGWQDADGGWREGPGAPADVLGHNKRIWYHGIILRACCDLYRVLPSGHSLRAPLLQAIQKAVTRAKGMQNTTGEITVGAGVPNEHRDAFIVKALIMAHMYCGIDCADTIRGVMQYRQDFSLPPYPSTTNANMDIEALGRMVRYYNTFVPNPPVWTATPVTITPTPGVRNGNFEADGVFFAQAREWLSTGYGKREGSQYSGHGWIQGLSDIPEKSSGYMYQIIPGVVPGARYRVTAETRATQSQKQLEGSVGIAGKETHNNKDASYSSGWRESTWNSINAEVQATENKVTVFIKNKNINDYYKFFDWVYFDNVSLTLVATAPPSTPRTPTPTPTMTGKVCMKGDTNCDSSVTPGDALIAFQIYLEVHQVTGNEPCNVLCAADYDSSSSVTPGDALCIFKLYMEQPC